MTRALFREDAYLRDAGGKVTGLTEEGGIILDATIFYPTSGGQPGDSGTLSWDGGKIEIAMAIKGQGDDVILVPAEPAAMPAVGTRITQEIDWERRLGHMRVHTALHLLSVVIPLPVTGGSISVEKGRLILTCLMRQKNKAVLDDMLNRLIACKFAVSDDGSQKRNLTCNQNWSRRCQSRHHEVLGKSDWCGSGWAKTRLTCSLAAAHTSAIPLKSAKSASARLKRKDAETGASICIWRALIRAFIFATCLLLPSLAAADTYVRCTKAEAETIARAVSDAKRLSLTAAASVAEYAVV